MSALGFFLACDDAVQRSVLIRRESRKDKEFHFQNWCSDRLAALKLDFDDPARNTYPDFRLVKSPIGFELKGLAFPGRHKDFDCNSQLPCGVHHGRTIYYVFGRYPKGKDESFPVVDLVVCHGDFLNAGRDYVHKNKSFRGLGSYGDILVRDRKMYVAPTPFGLLEGVERQVTLIVPEGEPVDDRVESVGEIERVETATEVTSYRFDLTTNELETEERPNPGAGTVHRFAAYRAAGKPGEEVKLKALCAGAAKPGRSAGRGKGVSRPKSSSTKDSKSA